MADPLCRIFLNHGVRSVFCYRKPNSTLAPHSRRPKGSSRPRPTVVRQRSLQARTTDTRTHDPATLCPRGLLFTSLPVVYYADLPLRRQQSSSENISSVAPCHTCSTRATQSASTLCSGCVLWTPAMVIISIVVGLLQRRSSRSLELETLPGRSSHDTEAVSSRKLVCSRRTTLSCEAAAENLSARTLGT